MYMLVLLLLLRLNYCAFSTDYNVIMMALYRDTDVCELTVREL